MAEKRNSTRRQFLAVAGLAPLAMIASAHASEPVSAGQMVFNLDGRVLHVDTTALPEIVEVTADEQFGPGFVSRPDVDAEYLVLFRGALVCTPLVVGSIRHLDDTARGGHLEQRTDSGEKISWRVAVLGKVVG